MDVIAPIDGTVIQRQVGLGQFLQAGASAPIFSIGDLAKVWLIANVRETDAAKVRVGQQVDVRVPAYPDHVFKARVTSVGPGLDTVTHRLPVRAEIDNADGALKPQMFASLGILTGDETSAIGVPESAIVTEGSSARVWVAFDDGTLALREIQVGRTAGHLTEVTSGLSAGDKVVTAGALFIDRAAQME